MRRVLFSMMVSLDGYYESPGEGLEQIDWHRADEEWEQYAVELLSDAGTLLFGRRTYEGFAQFWPTQEGEIARLLNTLPKVVVSTTLTEAAWMPSQVVRDNLPAAVRQLKEQPGKDIVMLGSGKLAQTLTEHGLIDEYRLAVNPVVLGAGTPLFTAGAARLNLRLLDTRVFSSGIVELRLAPER